MMQPLLQDNCLHAKVNYITLFQVAFQQTITSCLISLALLMRPKARAVMAAAEEIGQDDQIM